MSPLGTDQGAVPTVTNDDDSTFGDGSVSTLGQSDPGGGVGGADLTPPPGSLFHRANAAGRLSLKGKKSSMANALADKNKNNNDTSSSVLSGGSDSISRAALSLASSSTMRRSLRKRQNARNSHVADSATAELAMAGDQADDVVTPEKSSNPTEPDTPSTVASTVDDNTPQRDSVPAGLARSLDDEFGELSDVEVVESDVEVCHGDDDSTAILSGDRYLNPEGDEDGETLPGLDGIRKKAKEEWARGTERNRRYRAPSPASDPEDAVLTKDGVSEASLPSILIRDWAFHDDAASAIKSLLHPPRSGTRGQEEKDVAPSNGGGILGNSTKVIPDDGTSSNTGNVAKSPQGLDTSTELPTDPNISLIDEKTKAFLSSLQGRMIDPPKHLSDLLRAIARPKDGTPMDRGYMVRRKNACGALKVLTKNKANRKKIAWTTGVLTALTSVLDDAGEQGPKVAFQDPATWAAYIEAHKRATATILNLVSLPKNRVLIFHSPGLIQALSRVLMQDMGESLLGCCAILGYLSKTVENRLLMVKIPGLLGAMEGVIRPEIRAKLASVARGLGKNLDDSSVSSSSTGSDDESDSESASCSDSENDRHCHSSGGLSSDDVSLDKFLTTSNGENGSTERVSECPTPIRGTAHASRVNPSCKSPPTPTLVTVDSRDEYDKSPNKFLHGARRNIFAALLHLVKEKDNTYHMARDEQLIATLIDVANLHGSPSHTHAITILAHLTRHSGNIRCAVLHIKNFVSTLVSGTSSNNCDSRMFSCFALQNISYDKTCQQEVANTHDLLKALSSSAARSGHEKEQLAAIRTLQNLSDDPANLIPMTNTADCVGTLMRIASGDDEKVLPLLQYIACDTLATLSHWLRRVATSGMELEDSKGGGDGTESHSQAKVQSLFVPSIKVTQYAQWV